MKRAVVLLGLTLIVALVALHDLEAAQAPSRRTQRAWARALVQNRIAARDPRRMQTMPGARATVPRIRVR